MKKILHVLVACLPALFAVGQNIDVNLLVTSVSPTSITIAYQARSLPASTTIGKTSGNNPSGGFNQVLTYNSSALSFSAGSIDAIIPIGWPTQIVDGATAGTVTLNVLSPSGTGGANTVTIPTTFLTLASVTFNVTSTSAPLNFVFGATSFSQSGTARPINSKFDKVIYNGTNWSGGTGASGAPSSGIADLGKEIEVTSGSAVISTGDAQCDFINITGGTLTVAPNSSLSPWSQNSANHTTTATTFILDADATGYGEYKGPALALTAKQYWNPGSGRWINMGFPVTGLIDANLSIGGANKNYNGGTSAICTPVSGGTWGNYINTTNFYEFTNGSNGCSPTPAIVEHEWSGLTTAPTGGSQGYNVFIGGSFTSTGIISVQGTSIVSSTYAYTHTTPHSGGTGSQALNTPSNFDGWRLVANPFTCNLDIAAFATANGFTAASIKAWDGTAYVTPSAVAPFQSFWVKFGTAPSSATLTFASTHAVVGTATVTKTSLLGDHLVLNVANTTYQSGAYLILEPNATLGYDQLYDGHALMSSTTNFPNIAFDFSYIAAGNYIVKSPLSHSSVPAPQTSQAYPLVFTNNTAGAHTISVDATAMPAGYNVYIEDLLTAPGTLHSLMTNGYTFNHSVSNDPSRFVLHLSVSGIGIDEQSALGGVTAWFANDVLNFGNLNADEVYTVEVIDLSGRVVAKGTSEDAITVQKVGVYLVNLTSANGSTKTVKVVKM